MTRDFTDDEKEKLLEYVKQDDEKNEGRFLGGLRDWIADGVNYGGLDIADYLDDLDTYHKKLIDKEDYSSEDIENLFAAVSEVDTTYQKSFSQPHDLLIAINSAIKELGDLLEVNPNLPGSTKLFLDTPQFTKELSGVDDDLVMYYYQQYLIVNEDGVEEIDWNAVEEFFQRDVEDVSAVEYIAMMQLTDTFIVEDEDGLLKLDTEKMEKFMECAYSYESLSGGGSSMSASVTEAHISPVYIIFCKCMQCSTGAKLNAYGNVLYDENSDNSELVQTLEMDVYKTSIFCAQATNYQRLIVGCNGGGDTQQDVLDWKVNIQITEETGQLGSLISYKVSAWDGNMYENTYPGDVDVFGFNPTLEFPESCVLNNMLDSLYVDVEEKISEDIVKSIVQEVMENTAEKVLDKLKYSNVYVFVASFTFEEYFEINEAQSNNKIIDEAKLNNDRNKCTRALCLGGSANVNGDEMQIVYLSYNEEAFQQNIDSYNNNPKRKVDEITKEQLLMDYFVFLKTDVLSPELEDFLILVL